MADHFNTGDTPVEAATVHTHAEADVTGLTTDLAAKVAKTTADANSILYAVTDDTPAALAVAASRIVGRKATGDIAALTAAEIIEILGIPYAGAAGKAADWLGPLWTTPASSFVPGNNQAYATLHVIPPGRTIDQICLGITIAGEAGSIVRLGLYTDDDGWPKDLIAEAANVDATIITIANSTKAIAGPTAVNHPVRVWAVTAFQSATTTRPTVRRCTPIGPGAAVTSATGATNGSVAPLATTGMSGALPAAWPTARATSEDNQSVATGIRLA